MLKPKRKIGKKELKQDALLTTYAKVTAWYEKYRKRVGTTVTIAVIAALAVVVYMKNATSNEEQAAADLSKIQSYVDGAQYDLAIEGVPEKNIQGLRSIVENYGGTSSGEHARFYLASALLQLGQFDEAMEYFEECDPRGELLRVARIAGIAACHEALQQWESAAENFEKAAEMYPDNIDVPRNLNSAARNYVLAGQKEKALELYEKLKTDHSDTSFGREAPRYITQLSV